MNLFLKILFTLIILQSCKFAGFEKRRYRHGYFVQLRSEKDKIKNETQNSPTKKTEQPKPEVLTLENKPAEQEQNPELMASAAPLPKINVNKLLPIRTTFINEHLKESNQKVHKKKIRSKTNNNDVLIGELILVTLGLIWVAGAYSLKLLIPAMSLGVCFLVSGGILLTLLILLFVAYKKDQKTT